MCESRATFLGSLIGDEEDFMKEINNSLTNSLCLVPPEVGLGDPVDQSDEGEPRMRGKNNVQRN